MNGQREKFKSTFAFAVMVFSPIFMQEVKDSPCSTNTPYKDNLTKLELKGHLNYNNLN